MIRHTFIAEMLMADVSEAGLDLSLRPGGRDGTGPAMSKRWRNSHLKPCCIRWLSNQSVRVLRDAQLYAQMELSFR